MKTTKQHPDRNWRHRNGMALFSGALLLVISFLVGATSAFAATASPPSGIAYQGYLIDSSGSPLADDAPANVLIEFRIYDAETGGTAKYAEEQTVTVDNGAFSVLIGEGSAISGEDGLKLADISEVFDAVDASDRYVEITVDGGSAIAPRLRLLTSPYAFLAAKAVRAETVGDSSTSVLSFSGDEIEIESDLSVSGTGLFETGGTKMKHPIYVYHSNADLSTHHLYIDDNQIQSHGASGESDHDRKLNINTDGGDLSLSASGDTTTVNGDLVIGGDLTSDLVVDGTFAASGNATLNGTTTMNGTATMNGTTTMNGNTTISGSNTFTVGGASSLEGGLLIDGGGDADLSNWTLRVERSGAGMNFDNNEIQAVNSSGNATTLHLNHNGGNVAVDGGGRVGIGTNSPSVPLHIASNVGYSFYRTARYGDSNNSTGSNVQPNVCLLTNGAIVIDGGDSLYIVSDERLKDIQGRIESSDSLGRIMDLKLTEYRMRDSVKFGDSIHLGLIAQELEEVIPQAVQQRVGFVPDVYELSEKLERDQNSNELTIRIEGKHDLEVGQVIRLIAGSKQFERSVLAIPDANSFVVGDWSETVEELFVYGRQVDDFRTVDYNQVLLHGIAAMQEVNRRLEKSNEELLAKLSRVEQRNKDLGRLITSMNERFEALEGRVARTEKSDSDLAVNLRH